MNLIYQDSWIESSYLPNETPYGQQSSPKNHNELTNSRIETMPKKEYEYIPHNRLEADISRFSKSQLEDEIHQSWLDDPSRLGFTLRAKEMPRQIPVQKKKQASPVVQTPVYREPIRPPPPRKINIVIQHSIY